jgi:hypothetical protein
MWRISKALPRLRAEVASGHTHTHGEVVVVVSRVMADAERIHRGGTPAPDVTVEFRGAINGQPAGRSEFGPLCFAEVEYGNRSLLELIRYLGISTVFGNQRRKG